MVMVVFHAVFQDTNLSIAAIPFLHNASHVMKILELYMLLKKLRFMNTFLPYDI